mgnify:CR=1 FL=1
MGKKIVLAGNYSTDSNKWKADDIALLFILIFKNLHQNIFKNKNKAIQQIWKNNPPEKPEKIVEFTWFRKLKSWYPYLKN